MLTLNWQQHEGTAKPLEVDTVSSPTTVYLRRNITESPILDMDGNETDGTMYKYEEVQLTLDEYKEYLIQTESLSIKLLMQENSELQLQNTEMSLTLQESVDNLTTLVSDLQTKVDELSNK